MLSTKNPHSRQLFIIIVHYGQLAITKRAIAAIQANAVQPTQVIVIDQGPESVHSLATPDQSVVVLPSENAGYGAAANMGLGYLFTQPITPKDIVLFINNDVEMEPTAIAAIQHWWETFPNPALVGVTTIEHDQELSGAGRLSLFTGRTTLLPSSDSQLIDYIHGAAVMAPYEVWLRVQGWPEKYFLYWEDVLLSQRVRYRGYSLKVATPVRVRHDSSKEGQQKDTQVYYLVRNGALFLAQETAWPWRLVWRLINRVRLTWHQWQQKQPVVITALTDAANNVTGQRSV
jgi:GT2 family glycosyltransferase